MFHFEHLKKESVADRSVAINRTKMTMYWETSPLKYRAPNVVKSNQIKINVV